MNILRYFSLVLFLMLLTSCADSVRHDHTVPAAAAAGTVSQVKKQSKILPYPIYQHRLANGLNVVTVPFDSPGTAAFYIVVRVDSGKEAEKGVTGFAHSPMSYSNQVAAGLTDAINNEDKQVAVYPLNVKSVKIILSENTFQ